MVQFGEDRLSPASAERNSKCPYRELLQHAAAISQAYLQAIPERHAGVAPEAVRGLSNLGGPLPSTGENAMAVLDMLDAHGSPATVGSMGRRFFGGVVGGTFPIALAAHWIADSWDQNACLYDFSPVSAHLEDIVLGWLIDLFALPTSSGGAFVTGTQMANVTALIAARNTVLQRARWDVAADGLAGAPPIKVIVGEEVHATMLKALRMIGIGMNQLIFVPSDAQGRMKSSQIPNLRGPVIICAQAGNVNTGAFDPFPAICEIARDINAWVHVDGAFGLWATTSLSKRRLVAGIEMADSWATDAHKWLNVPQDSGIAIVRNAQDLLSAMTISAAYYPEPVAKREPMQWGPESSRRARAVEIWATLRWLGRTGVADLVDRTCNLTSRFASGFRAAGYEVLNEVELNQVMVSFGSDQRTADVVAAIQAEGTCWCGATVWKGRKAMRVSVSSWATTEADVDSSLKAILAVAESHAG
jgi:glutamate/tyrosine decarboxylase-like PLP-dependent enzyme